MKQTLIFSDVHLNVAPDGQERMDRFVRFLRAIDTDAIDRIIILGDLFDFWFEYRHVIFSGYFQVIRALADLHSQGVAFYFVCGNHDFWAGRFLSSQLGFEIHRGRLEMQFGPRRAWLIHGDGLNPRDTGYRFYKRIARSRLAIFLFGLLHPDWAMGIAQVVARGSRRLKKADVLEVSPEVGPLREFAVRTLESGEAEVVVLGHSHSPVMEEAPAPGGTGLYINSGDWVKNSTYVLWDGEAFTLHSFGVDTQVVPERKPERPGE